MPSLIQPDFSLIFQKEALYWLEEIRRFDEICNKVYDTIGDWQLWNNVQVYRKKHTTQIIIFFDFVNKV